MNEHNDKNFNSENHDNVNKENNTDYHTSATSVNAVNDRPTEGCNTNGYQGYSNYQSYTSYTQNSPASSGSSSNQGSDVSTYYYSQQGIQGYDPLVSPTPPKKNDSFGIVSFCLSLAFFYLSFVCCCCFCLPNFFATLFMFAIPVCEIAAIVLAFVSRKKMGRFTGYAIAGLVISVIVIVIIITFIIMLYTFYVQNPVLFENLDSLLSDPEFYKEFLPKHYPNFYYEHKEEIHEFFEKYFDLYEDYVNGTLIE